MLILNTHSRKRKAAKTPGVLWICKSSCVVAVTSRWFGLSWKVSLGRTASGLHPERARARASLTWGASLGTQYLLQLTGIYFRIQSQKWEQSSSGGREEKVDSASWLQISLSGNWLTQLFNTFPAGVVIPLWGAQAGIHRTDKVVLSASRGRGEHDIW